MGRAHLFVLGHSTDQYIATLQAPWGHLSIFCPTLDGIIIFIISFDMFIASIQKYNCFLYVDLVSCNIAELISSKSFWHRFPGISA